MSKRRVIVHSWGDEGPVFDVETRRGGFSNRRRRYAVESHGRRQRAALKDPAHHVVQVNGADHSVIFNKGHVYEAHVLIDAEHSETVHVDAREGFGELPLAPGVDFLSAEADSSDVSEDVAAPPHDSEVDQPPEGTPEMESEGGQGQDAELEAPDSSPREAGSDEVE